MNELLAAYDEARSTLSDIHEHLPVLVGIALAVNAQHIIELGVRHGASTAAWLYALAMTGGRLTSVDIEMPIAPASTFDRHRHWSFILGDDLDANVREQMRATDVLFIDTLHTYEHTLRELHAYLPLVRPRGVIVLHDTELESADGDADYPVRRAVESFVAETRLTWHNLPNLWGLGVIPVP